MSTTDLAPAKSSYRIGAGVLVLLEVTVVAGLQWLRSQGTHFDLIPTHEYGVLIRLLHIHAFHFRNVSGWALIHGLALVAGCGTAGWGSPRSVHVVTHAITICYSILGALLLASMVLG